MEKIENERFLKVENNQRSGSGSGIKNINNQEVYDIDGIQTIITHIKNNIAKGFILKTNLTLELCYIVKQQNYFAHGETLKQALEDMQKKIFDDMDIEDKINLFFEKFNKTDKYKGSEFYEWHNKLTGSCDMGRKSFVSDKNINLEDEFTVEEFIKLTKNSYGSSVIEKLEIEFNTKGVK